MGRKDFNNDELSRAGDLDSGTRLANSIEEKLHMSSDEIKSLTRTEFKNLLKNVYFAQKNYVKEEWRKEPTNKQLDILDLYYGKELSRKEKYYFIDHRTDEMYYVEKIRADYDKHHIRRFRDVKSGRFVAQKQK